MSHCAGNNFSDICAVPVGGGNNFSDHYAVPMGKGAGNNFCIGSVITRRKDEQTHPDLKFMEDGTAGRIHFDVIPPGNEEGQDIIRFKELERALS